jgi:hypothetical protein
MVSVFIMQSKGTKKNMKKDMLLTLINKKKEVRPSHSQNPLREIKSFYVRVNVFYKSQLRRKRKKKANLVDYMKI